jgi:hypothetical protein
MIRLEVQCLVSAIKPLLDVIKETSDTLASDLAAPLRIDLPDGEERAAWEGELLQTQNGDVGALLALFDRDFFASGSKGIVVLNERNAEPIVRACSALRLRLRVRALAEISDEALEDGSVDPGELSEPVRQAYRTYGFLAMLQDLILDHLDSALLP